MFHHHCAGYIETPAEIDRLLENTDTGLVNLVFDTGHYLFGSGIGGSGSDGKVLSVLERYNERGTGCVDFKGGLRWLNKRDYSGWVLVEQEVLAGMGSPKESSQRNRVSLRSIGL